MAHQYEINKKTKLWTIYSTITDSPIAANLTRKELEDFEAKLAAEEKISQLNKILDGIESDDTFYMRWCPDR